MQQHNAGRHTPFPGQSPSRQKNGLLFILISFVLITGAGCAKIAEPRPPQVRIPKPSIDLAARQISDYVVLSVSKPDANTNGSAPALIQRMEVYRLTATSSEGTTGQSEQRFLSQAKRILTIAAPKLKGYLYNSLIVLQDNFPDEKPEMYSHTYRYAVLFVNYKNQSAGLSNQTTITPIPIPPPPAGISTTGTQNSIRLKWAAPTENMDGSVPAHTGGYNIYRTEDPKRFPANPINLTPVTATEYEDMSFRFDATYYYTVTTLGSLQQPYPESLPSTSISFTAKDVFPPLPPADFSAIVQGNAIVLLWEPSPSTDVAGYRLYRLEKGKADRRLIQPEPVRGLSFRDVGVDPGKQYEYEIQTVDAYGNASPPVKTDSEQR